MTDQDMTAPKPAPVRGRLAPSPTGNLHLGNAFAFLTAWLSARAQGGVLVLRMEDIDPDRSRPQFAQGIMTDLDWLGLSWDEGPPSAGQITAEQSSAGQRTLPANGSEAQKVSLSLGPYTQSQRIDRYAAILADLQKRGLVYPCYCTRKELRTLASAPHISDEGAPYPGTCRSLSDKECRRLAAQGRKPALRLNTQRAREALRATGELPVAFDDAVLGSQAPTLEDCGGDFALRRSDGVYAYQLAVVADDAAMRITEVVRGDDLRLSTPRQILLFRLLGETPPKFAHLPLLHDALGQRLAKRHTSLELAALRAAGVRPEAVVGYLGQLAGWLGSDSPASADITPAMPRDLLARFSLISLQGRRLSVPDNIRERLLSI